MLTSRFARMLAYAALLAAACGDSDGKDTDAPADGATPPVVRDASTSTSPMGQSQTSDAGKPTSIDAGMTPQGPAPQGPGIDAAVADAQVVVSASDAGVTVVTDAGAADAGGGDAGSDAGNMDAGSAPDAGEASDASAPHPLTGRYAARTVSFGRQRSTVGESVVELVTKGVQLSIAEVSAEGVLTEHLCLIELLTTEGLYSWSSPAGTQRVPDSVATLERRGEFFVRRREDDRTNVAWSPASRPADCTTQGATHSSGCTCVLGDALPTLPNDCRVSDPDQDALPGLKLSLGGEQPVDPATAVGVLTMQIAGVKALEWELPTAPGAKLVGKVDGSVLQSQLSVAGEGASELGVVKNSVCPSETSHVELVKGNYDCAQILAGRSASLASHGIFDVSLDAAPPAIESCPDPE